MNIGIKNEADKYCPPQSILHIDLDRVVVLFTMTSSPFYLLSSKGHGLGFEQGHCMLRHLNRAAQFEE